MTRRPSSSRAVRRWAVRLAVGAAAAATVSVLAPQVALASNGRASMALAVSVESTVYGSTVTLTAELADDSGSCVSWRDCDTPTGRVAFFDNDVYIGSGFLGDHGPGVLHHQSYTEIDTTPTYVGFHHYRAQYAGDFDPVGSDDLRSIGRGQPDLTVTKASCSLALILDRASTTNETDPAIFTADLGSGGHAGTVDFITGNGPGGSLYWRAPLGTDGRTATFPFPAAQFSPGTYTFHAVYYGDANHLGCTSVGVSHERLAGEVVHGEVEIPTAVADQFHVDVDTPIDADILANDRFVAGYAVKPVIVAPPSHGTASIDPDTLRVTYQPDPGYVGADALSYHLIDADPPPDATIDTVYGDDANVTFNVDCRAAGHDDSYTVTQDVALVAADPGVLANDRGCGGGATVATAPAHGTVVLGAGGGLTYTPESGFTGLDSFTYTLDKDATATPVTVTLVVVTPTCTVALTDDEYSTTGPLTVASPGLVANDERCGNAIEVVQPPAHGSVVIAPGGGFTYTPATGYAGPDTFTYGLAEVSGTSGPALRASAGAFTAVDEQAPAAGATATVHITVTADEVTTTTTSTVTSKPTTSEPTTATTATVTSSTAVTSADSTVSAVTSVPAVSSRSSAALVTTAGSTPATPDGPVLADTGPNTASTLVAALALVAAGAVLVRLGRRRPSAR